MKIPSLNFGILFLSVLVMILYTIFMFNINKLFHILVKKKMLVSFLQFASTSNTRE